MDKLLYETGFGIVPKNLMVNREISCEAKCLFNYLAAFAGNSDSAFPGIDLIKYHLGWGNDRYYRARKELVEHGYLEVTQQKEKGKFSHNVYKLYHSPFTRNPESAPGATGNGKLKETVLKETDNNIYIASMKKIFEYWNSKKIIVHKQITDKLKKVMLKAIKEYGEDVILKAIENYSTMLQDESYFYSYKFSLENFLKQSNGLPHFVDEEGEKWVNYQSSLKANKGAYKKNGNPGNQQFQKEDESPQMGASEFYGLSTEDTFKLLSDMMKGEK